jgi:4-oxalocrotonate tautomerase family enzyme
MSAEQKEKIIKECTRITCEVTGLPAQAMIVLVHELNPDCIGLYGERLSKMKH